MSAGPLRAYPLRHCAVANWQPRPIAGIAVGGGRRRSAAIDGTGRGQCADPTQHLACRTQGGAAGDIAAPRLTRQPGRGLSCPPEITGTFRGRSRGDRGLRRTAASTRDRRARQHRAGRNRGADQARRSDLPHTDQESRNRIFRGGLCRADREGRPGRRDHEGAGAPARYSRPGRAEAAVRLSRPDDAGQAERIRQSACATGRAKAALRGRLCRRAAGDRRAQPCRQAQRFLGEPLRDPRRDRQPVHGAVGAVRRTDRDRRACHGR